MTYVYEITAGRAAYGGIMDERTWIRDWIAAFRRASYDPALAAEAYAARLTGEERRLLALDSEFLEQEQIEVIPDDAGSFPHRLTRTFGDQRPRMLFCAGDPRMLEHPGVMICGARDASPAGLDLAYRCGRLLGDMGLTVISGFARGVDMKAHFGALAGGGGTVAVLPYGLSRFSPSGEIREAMAEHSFLTVSEYPPMTGFSPRTAFRRNRVMVALAAAVIVVEPGDSGGTWFSARTAMEFGRALFYLEGGRPEFIPKLEELGATRIVVRRGAPRLEEVARAVSEG